MKANNSGKSSIGCLLVIGIIGLIGYVVYSSVKDSWPTDEEMAIANKETERIIQTKIPPSVVTDLPEIDWIEYDGNEIYIGFNKFDSDSEPMVNAWALQANWALDKGVHIWSVLDAPKGWRPGDGGKQCRMTTARHGKIQDN